MLIKRGKCPLIKLLCGYRMNQPPHYEKVLDLALEIVNAEDKTAEWQAYNQLNLICQTHENSDLDHPFQWETLGDYTRDPEKALPIYFKALNLAVLKGFNDYIASINLAISEQYKELRNFDKAWEYANLAQESANKLSDLSLKQDISEILIELSKST